MSLAYNEKRRCGVCGATKIIRIQGGHGTYGASDLDTRPAGSRSEMSSWITCCDNCHYCAPDLEKTFGLAAKVLALPEYQYQFAMQGLPETARHFLCHGLLSWAQGQIEQAIWACIHAAWVCDDEGMAGDACRVRALKLIEQLEAGGIYLGESLDSHHAIIVDLLRRSFQFEGARSKAEEGLAALSGPSPIADILKFQLELIERHDFADHSLNEVLFTVLTNCHTCGHPLDGRSNHCGRCGASISSS